MLPLNSTDTMTLERKITLRSSRNGKKNGQSNE